MRKSQIYYHRATTSTKTPGDIEKRRARRSEEDTIAIREALQKE